MDFIKNLSGSNNLGSFTSKLSSNAINNLVIFISFGVMIYILVQMVIVLNRPEFLYYTLSPSPTDLSTEPKLKSLEFSEKLPATFTDEFTYSFWMYLRTIDSSSSSNHKLVFMRTDQSENTNIFLDANPIVYLQKNTNKLIIKIRTSDAALITGNSIPKTTITDDFHESKCAYRTIIIDYIPLKRWVNVIINVDNNRITIFLDGDIYKTLLIDLKQAGCTPTATSFISETKGIIKVGKVGNETPPDALISKVQFYNYSLKTPSDIRQIYNDGPVESEGILDTLGFEYKFRYPIYKIGEEETCDN